MLARSITAPVARLSAATVEVAQGRFDVKLDETGQDELARLSQAFNQMTAGLRERADMQKFVSQSTVAMIQRGPGTPAGRVPAPARSSRCSSPTSAASPPSPSIARPRKPSPCSTATCSSRPTWSRAFHGDVDKFIGDAVFAHFTGADKALDAIRCAVEIHRAVAAASADDPALPPMQVGVGIVTGEVIVGSIGGGDRLDYTAIGAAVNLAERLCGVAGPGETLMNDATFEAVRGLVAAEPAPPLSVKGFGEPVHAFRMRG